MVPYALTKVDKKTLELFYKIREVIKALPEIDLGRDENGQKFLISCHMLTRVCSLFFPVQFRDGYYLKIFEHSWLLPDTDSNVIIDVYPVAIVGGPILLAHLGISFLKDCYKESALPKLECEIFKIHTELVASVFGETMKKLG